MTTSDAAVIRKMENRHAKRDQTRNLERVLADRAWSNERAFIIGGGPSLTGFDFSRLKNERIIAINKAFRDVMFADIVYFMDFVHFYNKLKDGKFGDDTLQKWHDFKGHKVFADSHVRNLDDVLWVNLAWHQHGVSSSQRRGLHRGTNCGYGALNLAIVLGANPIYLLGYDMQRSKDKTHYHEGYRRTANQKALIEFAASFTMIYKDIRAKKISVVNLNPKSKLRCFKFSTIEEVLDGKI